MLSDNRLQHKHTHGQKKSLMGEWLGWVSQGYETYCHDMEVMGTNPSLADFELHSTSVSVVLELQNSLNLGHMCC